MSEDNMVVVPGSTPEWIKWLDKKKGIFEALEGQLIQGLEVPGTGITLDDLQLVVMHQHPAVPARTRSPLELVFRNCQRALRRKFGPDVTVDPLPAAITEANMAKWAKFNLRPVFLPGEEIGEERPLRNWKKSGRWFYDQIRAGNIADDSAKLRRGWYLADFTVGTDYTDGTQVFANDPLANLILSLRIGDVVGKFDATPLGSRFAISNIEWREKVLPTLTDALSATGVKTFRLERAIDFNAIGNIYDSNRGRFNMWEWFDDSFDSVDRLYGGDRGSGGLADVSYGTASDRAYDLAGRPLGCFV